MADNKQGRLERGLGLKEATAINMIDMVGIGPFVVIALVIKIMGGPQAIIAWVAGALLAFVDAFVWSELGAAMPRAGGSYVFLREAYGPKWGRMMSFLFVWQTMIQAPMVMASASIGFARYAGYVWQPIFGVPLLDKYKPFLSGGLVLLMIVLLYRRITTIGKISIVLWICMVGTIAWVIFGGVTHFRPELAFDYPPGAWDLSAAFFAALGMASVKTIYSYLGYYNVCHLGGEIREPERVIPKSMFISIAGIAVLYLAMNMSVLGVVPWRVGQNSEFIVSTFIETIYGSSAAYVVTGLILVVALSSLFSLMLGYSRVPYAAATDGAFFKVFARIHPTKNFPHVSHVVLGLIGFVFSLFAKLEDVIAAIIATRIIVQFIGQAVGVMVIRSRRPDMRLPFRMWLYPLPALLAIIAWIGIFVSTGFALGGAAVIALGLIVFLIRAKTVGEWPFGPADDAAPGEAAPADAG